MKLSKNNWLLVKPPQPTWTGFIPLSDIDLVGSLDHVLTVYFYNPPWENAAVFQTLEAALAKVLVHFYPLAGRLSPGARRGCFRINCNAAGTLLAEAESAAKLDELPGSDDLRALVPCVDIKATPLEEYPLLVAQVTTFACSSVGIGVAISHAVVDGMAAANLIRQWARVTQGEPVEEEPFVDRNLLVNMGINGEQPEMRLVEFDEIFDEKLEEIQNGACSPSSCTRITFTVAQSHV